MNDIKLRHDCVKENCKPSVIVDKLSAVLANLTHPTNLTLRECGKNFVQLHLHQPEIQKQIIAHDNYILFRKVAEHINSLRDESPILDTLLELAQQCANLEWMLHAKGNAAFKKSIEREHFKTASVILQTIQDLKDNVNCGDIQHFNAANFQLVMKHVILKVISSLSNPSILVFTIKDYDKEVIKDYNLSVSDGRESPEHTPTLIKRLTTAVSTFSMNSIPSLPIKFKVCKNDNDLGNIKLTIFNPGCEPTDPDPNNSTTFMVPMNEESSTKSVCPSILSWCSNPFTFPVAIAGNIAEDSV